MRPGEAPVLFQLPPVLPGPLTNETPRPHGKLALQHIPRRDLDLRLEAPVDLLPYYTPLRPRPVARFVPHSSVTQEAMLRFCGLRKPVRLPRMNLEVKMRLRLVGKGK